jgi:hypothetical protein
MDNVNMANNYLQELQRQWLEQDDGALLMYALSFLDVKTLLQKLTVNKAWRKFIQDTIDAKCGQDGPQAFESNEELKRAVDQYCNYEAADMEAIACTYGYPIDKCDVSQLDDMSELFLRKSKFNEYIASLSRWIHPNVRYLG